uniref:Uncharacterized protein n=1 Tax=Lepeophtheirus salmonis TaxID=72036 RepID=A0A0K2V7M8_LEPSM
MTSRSVSSLQGIWDCVIYNSRTWGLISYTPLLLLVVVDVVNCAFKISKQLFDVRKLCHAQESSMTAFPRVSYIVNTCLELKFVQLTEIYCLISHFKIEITELNTFLMFRI